MYLWPRAEVTGYLPGKSVAIVCLSALVSMVVILIWCCLFVFGTGLSGVVGSGWVVRMPCLIFCRCPSAVYGDSWSKVSIRDTVSPGHEI